MSNLNKNVTIETLNKKEKDFCQNLWELKFLN